MWLVADSDDDTDDDRTSHEENHVQSTGSEARDGICGDNWDDVDWDWDHLSVSGATLPLVSTSPPEAGLGASSESKDDDGLHRHSAGGLSAELVNFSADFHTELLHAQGARIEHFLKTCFELAESNQVLATKQLESKSESDDPVATISRGHLMALVRSISSEQTELPVLSGSETEEVPWTEIVRLFNLQEHVALCTLVLGEAAGQLFGDYLTDQMIRQILQQDVQQPERQAGASSNNPCPSPVFPASRSKCHGEAAPFMTPTNSRGEKVDVRIYEFWTGHSWSVLILSHNSFLCNALTLLISNFNIHRLQSARSAAQEEDIKRDPSCNLDPNIAVSAAAAVGSRRPECDLSARYVAVRQRDGSWLRGELGADTVSHSKNVTCILLLPANLVHESKLVTDYAASLPPKPILLTDDCPTVQVAFDTDAVLLPRQDVRLTSLSLNERVVTGVSGKNTTAALFISRLSFRIFELALGSSHVYLDLCALGQAKHHVPRSWTWVPNCMVSVENHCLAHLRMKVTA
jgi:hypothetical protein